MSESEETPNVGETAPAPVVAEAPPVEAAAAPAPEPEPEAAPTPVVGPEAAPAPEAVPVPAPTPEPVPAHAPATEPVPAHAPAPEPVLTPAPAPVVEPVATPAPAPVVEHVAVPTPEVKPKTTTPPAKETDSKASDSVDKGVSPPPTGVSKSNLTPGSPPGQETRKTSDFKAHSPPVQELAPLEKIQKQVREFFDSMPAAIVMSIVTLWALFGDDIRIATCPKDMDMGFTVSLSICFFMFLMEFMAGCFASPEYINLTYVWGEKFEMKHIPGSFYFYLDIIATASLGFELSWMNGGDDSEDAGEWVASGEFESNTGASSTSQRVVTMLRMVRIVRMVKFYKYYQINQKKREVRAKALKRAKARKSFNNKDTGPAKVEETAEVRESSVGQAMTALTTQRVLVLVFGMLFIIPLFTEADSNMEARYKAEMCRNFESFATDGAMNLAELLDFLFTNDSSTLGIVQNDDEFFSDETATLVRLSNYRPAEVQVLSSGSFTVFQKNKINAVEGAKFSMGLTAFITVLLMVGTMVFSHDVRSLVITPIEKMVELVQKIAVNPLGVDYTMNDDDDAFAEGMETTLLLQTINKIGSLMRVGFGEAGANVIAKNLAESKGGKLNMMGAGTTITSIFGFCDVRQFTDTTECLQEEVMLFVNRIAHILHSIVVQCSGAANKNIGDAFLLTWKLEEGNTKAQNTALADQALVAFLKGLVELNRHQDFICNFSVAATARLFKRFPGYNVRIGCGLHVGWAIEGAIGTHRKIDASYLSPSVNMSEYLESSTKAYGVPILLSEPFYDLLSVHATKYCRQVDSIYGPLENPFGMFTYDSDLDYDFNAVVATTSALKAASVFKSKLAARKANRDAGKGEGEGRRRSSLFGVFDKNPGPGGPEKRPKRTSIIAAPASQRRGSAFNDIEMQKISETQKKLQEERKNKAPEIKVNVYEKGVWERDADLIQLRHLVNDSFRVTWAGGIKAYISGDWAEAIRIFTQTLDISRGTDGPSMFLLELMKGHGGRAPADWKGYRLD